MLQEADQYKGEDEITKLDVVAKGNLKAYITRLTKSLDDLDKKKFSLQDRERLEGKIKDIETWLEAPDGLKAGKEEFEGRQKELEAAMATVMLKISQMNSELWEGGEIVLHDGAKTIAQGGFHLETGVDIRELLDDPQ